QVQPRSLLFLGNKMPELLSLWAADNSCQLTTLGTQTSDWQNLASFDFAVVADYLEQLSKSDGLQRLARLRNLHSPRIWLLIDEASAWEFADFISLGFRRCGSFAVDQRILLCY